MPAHIRGGDEYHSHMSHKHVNISSPSVVSHTPTLPAGVATWRGTVLLRIMHGTPHPHLIASSLWTNTTTATCASSQPICCDGAVESSIIVRVTVVERAAPIGWRVYCMGLLTLHYFDAVAHSLDGSKLRHRASQEIKYKELKLKTICHKLSKCWNRLFKCNLQQTLMITAVLPVTAITSPTVSHDRSWLSYRNIQMNLKSEHTREIIKESSW